MNKGLNKGLVGAVLAAAMTVGTGIGCASRGPIRAYDDHVLFKRNTHGTRSIEMKVTDRSGFPYCESQVWGISCEFPLEYLTQPRFEFLGMDESFSVCRYAMRYARPSYWDVQACSVELMSMKLNELREPDKNQ